MNTKKQTTAMTKVAIWADPEGNEQRKRYENATYWERLKMDLAFYLNMDDSAEEGP